MKLLAEIAVEMCWHVSFEQRNESVIMAVAIDGARTTRAGCIWAFASGHLKSFGPYMPEWSTVVQ